LSERWFQDIIHVAQGGQVNADIFCGSLLKET